MSNSITGKIFSITPAVSMPTKGGSTFTKRSLVLDCGYTGSDNAYHDNPICIDFANDKVSLLDGLQPGMQVTVYFNMQGRYYEPKNSFFVDLRGWKVEMPQMQAPQPQQPQYPQQMPQQYAQPMPQYPQQQAAYQAPQQQYPFGCQPNRQGDPFQ